MSLGFGLLVGQYKQYYINLLIWKIEMGSFINFFVIPND